MSSQLKAFFEGQNTYQEPDWYFTEDGEVIDLQHRIDVLEQEMRQLDALQINLECLHDIALEMDEPSEREIRLLRLNVQTVLADTQYGIDTLFPGLEDTTTGSDFTPSLEAVGGVLKRMIETILKWMKTIWEYMVKFFNKIFDNNKRLSSQNDKMRERMETASRGKLHQKKVELSNEILNLTVDGQHPKNAQAIIEGLRRLCDQSDVIFKDYTANLAKAGNAMADAITAYDSENPETSLRKVYEAAKEVDLTRLSQLIKGQTINDSRWKDGSVTALSPLPGNQSIFFFMPFVPGKDALLAKSELRRRKAITIDVTQDKKKDIKASGTIDTIEPSEGYEIHRLNKELIQRLDDYHKQRKDIDKAHDKVQKAIKKMESLQGKVNNDSTSHKVYFEEVARYGQTFSYWVKNPHVGLATQIQKTIRASIIAANHSANNYRQY